MFDRRLVRRCPAWGLAVMALAAAGCAPGLHTVRLRMPDGRERTVVPRPHLPVVITEEDFQRATVALARNVPPIEDPLEYARQQFEAPVRSGWFFYDRRTRQITPLDPATAADFLPVEVVELTRNYLQWCHNRQEPGDCLRLLRHGYALDADARLAVAMDIALGSVMEEVAQSLKGAANGDAVRAMIVAAAVMYGVLLVAPEPISKLIAATMTAALVVYLGVDTICGLRDGWRRLAERADAADTFDELRSAGEQFGKLMGANAARILVMVAAAAVGSGAGGAAKMLPELPGIGQALRFVTAEGVEVEAEAVQSVAIAESSITFTPEPAAVAMSTIETHRGEGSPGPRPSAAGDGGLSDLARLREDLGLKAGEGTLARLDVGGRSFYGINAHGQPIAPLRANAISATHAEADVFAQAARAGVSDRTGTLYVDRALCPSCDMFGGVRSMARQLGLESLKVVTPGGTITITP